MKRLFKLPLLIAMGALLFAACQKDNSDEQIALYEQQTVQRFLTLPPNANSELVRIAAVLAKQNNEKQFIPKLVGTFGYAEWAHPIRLEENGVVNYLIPLNDPNTKKVKAVLQAILTQSGTGFDIITQYNGASLAAKRGRTKNGQAAPDEMDYRAMRDAMEAEIYGRPTSWLYLYSSDSVYLGRYPYSDSTTVQAKEIVVDCGKRQTCVGATLFTYEDFLYLESIGAGHILDNVGDLNCKWTCVSTYFVRDNTPYLWEDWWNDFPTGGGGGGGGSGDWNDDWNWAIDEPKPDEDPCIQYNNSLGQSTAFQDKMKGFQDKISVDKEQRERGVTMNKLTNGTYTYGDEMEGPVGDCTLGNQTLKSPIWGFIHSHFEGCFSIFSMQDVEQMYKWHKTGYMLNAYEFVFGLVTKDGAYMLKISDLKKFKKFGETFFVDNGDSNASYWALDMYVKTGQSASQGEAAFLQMLSTIKGGTGLSLYKATSSNFSSWQKMERDSKGIVKMVDCK